MSFLLHSATNFVQPKNTSEKPKKLKNLIKIQFLKEKTNQLSFKIRFFTPFTNIFAFKHFGLGAIIIFALVLFFT